MSDPIAESHDQKKIDRSEVRTWRWLIPWPGGPLCDPDGNLIDGSFKRGVYELLDEIEKPASQRDRNRIQLALRQFAPGVLDQARRDYLDGGLDLMIGWLGYYDPRFLWISEDMKNALVCVLADEFLPSTFGNGATTVGELFLPNTSAVAAVAELSLPNISGLTTVGELSLPNTSAVTAVAELPLPNTSAVTAAAELPLPNTSALPNSRRRGRKATKLETKLMNRWIEKNPEEWSRIQSESENQNDVARKLVQATFRWIQNNPEEWPRIQSESENQSEEARKRAQVALDITETENTPKAATNIARRARLKNSARR